MGLGGGTWLWFGGFLEVGDECEDSHPSERRVTSERIDKATAVK